MAVMVTGGTGFIGNRIVRKLADRGEEVVCFDLAPPRANLEPYIDTVRSGRVHIYRGDITQMPHLLEAINSQGVDRIIHLAALLPPDTEERPHFSMLSISKGPTTSLRRPGGPESNGWSTQAPSPLLVCRRPSATVRSTKMT